MHKQKETKLAKSEKKKWKDWSDSKRKDWSSSRNVATTAFEPDWPKKDGLRFTPPAWQKLLYMLHRGSTEVGGWGVVTKEEPLLVYGFHLIEQEASSASFEFTASGIENYRMSCIETGLDPAESERIWIHTHPGSCPSPSPTDEENFRENMGEPPPHWSVMFIIDRDHGTYARLRFNVGPCANIKLGVSVDWKDPMNDIDVDAWDKEYKHCIKRQSFVTYPQTDTKWRFNPGAEDHDGWEQDEHGVWTTGKTYGQQPSQATEPKAPHTDDKRYDLTQEEYPKFYQWLQDAGIERPGYITNEERALIDAWQASVVKQEEVNLNFLTGPIFALNMQDIISFRKWAKSEGYSLPTKVDADTIAMIDLWREQYVDGDSLEAERSLELQVITEDCRDGEKLMDQPEDCEEFKTWVRDRGCEVPEVDTDTWRVLESQFYHEMYGYNIP